jgi:hypothetical protein
VARPEFAGALGDAGQFVDVQPDAVTGAVDEPRLRGGVCPQRRQVGGLVDITDGGVDRLAVTPGSSASSAACFASAVSRTLPDGLVGSPDRCPVMSAW